MPALLVSHHRPGFYLRVITEGEVEAGDEIVKVASGPGAITVAEIDALLYLPGHPRDALARALRIPALSPGWKASLQALLDQAESGGARQRRPRPPPARRRRGPASARCGSPRIAPESADRHVGASGRRPTVSRCRRRCPASS